jgi:hypothetical protein
MLLTVEFERLANIFKGWFKKKEESSNGWRFDNQGWWCVYNSKTEMYLDKYGWLKIFDTRSTVRLTESEKMHIIEVAKGPNSRLVYSRTDYENMWLIPVNGDSLDFSNGIKVKR